MWSDWIKYTNLLVAFCLIGVVDQIHGQLVEAEVTNQDGVSDSIDLPLWMFPCEVSEGDMFYFTKVNGVLELRCGEPPPE
tara:strand:- start:506 stop:745 length:240 start_codon:yes stop_codon:yes gene_type:complete